jgi:hypothetical protein
MERTVKEPQEEEKENPGVMAAPSQVTLEPTSAKSEVDRVSLDPAKLSRRQSSLSTKSASSYGSKKMVTSQDVYDANPYDIDRVNTRGSFKD